MQLGKKWYVRDRGFKLTESGNLYDMSDAPFIEKAAFGELEGAVADVPLFAELDRKSVV